MPCDIERVERLQQAMREAGLDALACALPENVLLLTGYFPVIGTSIAIVTRSGEVTILAPRDEVELAQDCAHELVAFEPGSLECITGATAAVREPLQRVLQQKHLTGAVIGYECGASCEPVSYAAMHFYGSAIPELLGEASLRPAGELLAREKSVLTLIEIDRVRRACRIAEEAFDRGRQCLRAGLKETEAAAHFRAPLSTVGTGFEGVSRSDGMVCCMSGVNSAKAYGAYARSHARQIEIAEFVLTHCNSHADGYWTDITRTYCTAPPADRHLEIYEALFEARVAGLAAVRPGECAGDVDRAVRDVLSARGFGGEFKHPTGHGVGFAAIDHNALPRIHPQSTERLAPGMVFNIEPGIYIDGFGGARHCDVVAVTHRGVELLTPFQCRIEELIR